MSLMIAFVLCVKVRIGRDDYNYIADNVTNITRGMSDGYNYQQGNYYFCNDKCVGEYFGDDKAFTSLEDWNANGPGLTWKEFQEEWEKISVEDYAYNFALDICHYTQWYQDNEWDEVYDRDGKAYNFDDVCDDSRSRIRGG